MKYISDIIKEKDVREWDGKTITISAPTGSGKSYFIKNILYKIVKSENKKILMLIHRTNCIDQFKAEILRDIKTDSIDIMSYQSLEYNKYFNLDNYKYIVCDEFHYFIGDAAFNKNTDISLNLILKMQGTTKIFMSATGDYVKDYLNKVKRIPTIDYSVPRDYSFIKQLSFYNTDHTTEELLNEFVSRKEKSIFFIDSATKAYKLYNQNKNNCFFNCSKGNKYYKHVDAEKINSMLVNERFDDTALITTTAFDSGINIVDKELINIVVDVKDVLSLIQCIGRKRIQSKDDRINVYIKTMNNCKLGGLITQSMKKIEKAEFLRTHCIEEYIQIYSKQSDKYDIVYDTISERTGEVTKVVNELMYYRCLLDVETYTNMKRTGNFGYSKYLADYFNLKYKIIDTEMKKNSLKEFLDSHVGDIMYTAKNRKELIDQINVRSDGKQLKRINNLNGALEELELPFRIIEFRTTSTTNKKRKEFKSAWKIEKLTTNI